MLPYNGFSNVVLAKKIVLSAPTKKRRPKAEHTPGMTLQTFSVTAAARPINSPNPDWLRRSAAAT